MQVPSTNYKLASWLAATAVVVLLLAQAGGALAPFIIATIIAYIGVPAVNKLENKGINRTGASLIVLFVLMIVLLLVPLIFLPFLISQAIDLMRAVPDALTSGWQWIAEKIPGAGDLTSTSSYKDLFKNISFDGVSIGKASTFVAKFIGGILANIAGIFTLLSILVISPLVAFFLLRDWTSLLNRIKNGIPAPIRPTVVNVASVFDNTMSEFLRAQFAVMMIMAVVYSVLLLFAGTPFAVAIGLLAGVLCFIPYAGFGIGLVLALIATALNLESWYDLLWTAAAMTVGTTIESFWLTPKIVGERSGLGPVAVLLAISVMGALFGFAGVLLAVPIAAVFFALWRHYFPSKQEETS